MSRAPDNAALVGAEKMEQGAVALAVYWTHFKAMGGVPILVLMTISVVLTQTAIVMSDYWLAYWTQGTTPWHDGPSGETSGWYLGCK